MENQYLELFDMHHIPNGGARFKATAGRLKAEGVKEAIPDIFLPAARGGYHGLYIEMKRIDGEATADQLACHERLRRQGYFVVVCKGCDAAIDVTEHYLKL